MIAIVDTGGANLASVLNALGRAGKSATVSADADTIFRASKVILPGVGAAGDSMSRLKKKELTACLRELRQPTLGICLGMQLLFERSEEGDVDCLGVLPGVVRRLAPAGALPIPHMGWNAVTARRGSSLFAGIPAGSYFYFVHSFAAPEGAWVVADCDYGGAVPAVVEHANYFGAQFHPEKSAGAGARFLENFLSL